MKNLQVLKREETVFASVVLYLFSFKIAFVALLKRYSGLALRHPVA